MQRYRKLSGDSGVDAYRIERDSITIRFRGGAIYSYIHAATGAPEVEEMKRLALAGKGLSTFISTRVRKRYARKLA